jgi:hypothetical protein
LTALGKVGCVGGASGVNTGCDIVREPPNPPVELGINEGGVAADIECICAPVDGPVDPGGGEKGTGPGPRGAPGTPIPGGGTGKGKGGIAPGGNGGIPGSWDNPGGGPIPGGKGWKPPGGGL